MFFNTSCTCEKPSVKEKTDTMTLTSTAWWGERVIRIHGHYCETCNETVGTGRVEGLDYEKPKVG